MRDSNPRWLAPNTLSKSAGWLGHLLDDIPAERRQLTVRRYSPCGTLPAGTASLRLLTSAAGRGDT